MLRINYFIVSCYLFGLGINSSDLFSQNNKFKQVRYANTITKEDLKKHLYVLASDEYEGRETGTRGQKRAAEYIAMQFSNDSVRPGMTDGGYFQNFLLEVQAKKFTDFSINKFTYRADKDFVVLSTLLGGSIDANEIIFVGYGIDEENYSDYKKVNLENKIVMVLDKEPVGNDSIYFISKSKTESPLLTSYRKKEEAARKRNAKALLIVSDNIDSTYKQYHHRASTKTMRLQSKEPPKIHKTPVIFISKQMANEIIDGNKTNKIDDWKNQITKKKKSYSKRISTTIKTNIVVEEKIIDSENVLGYIEGTDLKEELLVITAHYDHLGVKDSVVYNGADDDGSGTVAVIELAQAFSIAKKEGVGPRRSILFLTVAGEEKGLLGSEYYTKNPAFPIKTTIANLNIDMIGRVDVKHKDSIDYIYIIGSDKMSSELHRINENANKQFCKLNLDYTYNDINEANRFYYRSDHYNFVKQNVPIIFYFNGIHEDYHKETDEISKINFDLMEKRTKLVFYTAWELANRDERIKIDVKQ